MTLQPAQGGQRFAPGRATTPRIAVNTSAWLAAADGLSHSGYQRLVETLGRKYADRLVSSENLITDFRVRRVQSEIVAFANAGEMTRRILEQALSREVITPGITTGEDVFWWVRDQLLVRGLTSSFGRSMLRVIHSTVAEPSEYRSSQYAFQRGDLLSFDMGVKYLNFGTDMKRNAYLLGEGATSVPGDIQHAWDEGRRARDIMRQNIKVGRTAAETLEAMVGALEEAGFAYTPFVNDGATDRQIVESFDRLDVTGISIDCHVVGNTGNSQVAVGPLHRTVSKGAREPGDPAEQHLLLRVHHTQGHALVRRQAPEDQLRRQHDRHRTWRRAALSAQRANSVDPLRQLFQARCASFPLAGTARYNSRPKEGVILDYRVLGRTGVRVSPLCLGSALLHGPEQIADLPVPVAESPGAVRIGHPERSHLVEYLAPNSVFNSLPRQRSSPHLRPDDRLVTIDRVLHHASLGVA